MMRDSSAFVSLHQVGVLDEHRVLGSKEFERGFACWSYCGLFFTMTTVVGDDDGTVDPHVIGQARQGYWATSSRVVPGRVLTLCMVGALVHGGGGHDRGGHPRGDWTCHVIKILSRVMLPLWAAVLIMAMDW
ncbi:hypothetical protein ZIOFF_069862 [Zingiber officinale]|uniref:Uncharacterized protein n=1 Tax=Zingiber officinale TaxID=94328 RepID=A0A8J5EQ86_ZINOF|nr:hypothetical protein ZIOFF_069862 [Zingiber officinale]